MALWGDGTSGAGEGWANVAPSLPCAIIGDDEGEGHRRASDCLVSYSSSPTPAFSALHLLPTTLPEAQQLIMVSGFLGTLLLGYPFTKPEKEENAEDSGKAFSPSSSATHHDFLGTHWKTVEHMA